MKREGDSKGNVVFHVSPLTPPAFSFLLRETPPISQKDSRGTQGLHIFFFFSGAFLRSSVAAT